jgi:hypothetical protein
MASYPRERYLQSQCHKNLKSHTVASKWYSCEIQFVFPPTAAGRCGGSSACPQEVLTTGSDCPRSHPLSFGAANAITDEPGGSVATTFI